MQKIVHTKGHCGERAAEIISTFWTSRSFGKLPTYLESFHWIDAMKRASESLESGPVRLAIEVLTVAPQPRCQLLARYELCNGTRPSTALNSHIQYAASIGHNISSMEAVRFGFSVGVGSSEAQAPILTMRG